MPKKGATSILLKKKNFTYKTAEKKPVFKKPTS